ncbi:MAG: sterol desaturase family protein [Betaproteobacteria bacterium]|nr:sterol desaturase family protein [Betaproteobacteria bacterium]
MDINAFVQAHEVAIRLGAFFGIFALMALWEILAPRRRLSVSKPKRWLNNLGVVVLNSVVVRLLFPAAAVGVAAFAASHGWGIFNYLQAPFWAAVALSFVAMDFAIYLQHVMFHAVPVLWRLHRMHHADLDFDVTTGARFHPIEIVLSMLIKFAVIVVLGAPVLAVVLFEVVLNGTAMFNHGNVRLAGALDRRLRWVLVTPDMHRVHHSIEEAESNTNFGFNLSLWDRLFGTYTAAPRLGHEGMAIGVRGFRDERQCATLPGMLAIPFQGTREAYSISRRFEPGHEIR